MLNFLKKKWIWVLYILMFGTIVSTRAFAFFFPSQQVNLYYKIYTIMSINMNHLPILFIFTIASLILGYFTFIFLWFYVFEKKVFSIDFVILIFFIRILCDMRGHSYEWNTVRSLYFQSPITAWNDGLLLFFLILPSYLAMTDYVVQKIKRHATANHRPQTAEQQS